MPGSRQHERSDTTTQSPRRPPGHELVRLIDGRTMLLRPIHADDAEPIAGAFVLLTPDEIRNRYLHMLKALAPSELHRLVRPDHASECVLVAAEPLPPGEALVAAVARAAIEPPHRDAEFAILVSRYIAGMGVGRMLMRRLVRWARRKRVNRLYGDVLESNLPMLELARTLGFHRERSESPGLVRVVLDLSRDR